jgi:hypothetical protein
MITRDFGDGGWKAAGRHNPPPLHVRDTESAAANWFPLVRPRLAPQHPGPVLVRIPGLPADELGEDPTDPARCHTARQPTAGMQARLNIHAGRRPNVGPGGKRR